LIFTWRKKERKKATWEWVQVPLSWRSSCPRSPWNWTQHATCLSYSQKEIEKEGKEAITHWSGDQHLFTAFGFPCLQASYEFLFLSPK
jgi:hypothetical protein